MSEYYHVVPWYNSQEWNEVYDKIFSENSTRVTKSEALQQLLVWKARCPSLPSGIESTLTLLEMHLQDDFSDSLPNDQLLRLGYSSAIMRFVNHMLDTETSKGTNLYQAAKRLGVPDWIVDLRHDTAHSNKLPSLELLREASLFSLQWLQKYYWDKYKKCIQDYVSNEKENIPSIENKIAAMMHFCASLSICGHPQCDINTLADIPDDAMRVSSVNDAKDLFGDYIDLSVNTVSIQALINAMKRMLRKLLIRSTSYSNKALLNDESLILSQELLEFMDKTALVNKKGLSRHYVQCFEMMLRFLHSNELLQDFIMELISITQDDDNDDNRRWLAAQWLSEILIALKKCNQLYSKANKSGINMSTVKSRKELISLFCNLFPSEKMSSLLLDFNSPILSELTNINYIKPIISSYNPYLTYFIKDLLNLVEPHIDKNIKNKICKLAEVVAYSGTLSATTSDIYTAEDLKHLDMNDASIESDKYKHQNVQDQLSGDDDIEIVNQQETTRFGIWQLTPQSTDYSWSSCPIGILPLEITNQSKEMES